MGKIIGIDLGTTNSCVAQARSLFIVPRWFPPGWTAFQSI